MSGVKDNEYFPNGRKIGWLDNRSCFFIAIMDIIGIIHIFAKFMTVNFTAINFLNTRVMKYYDRTYELGLLKDTL